MDSNLPNANVDLTQRFALDLQGFDSLRAQAGASPQQSLKTVAKQFDAVFLQMMLKSMREATPSDGPLDSQDGKQLTSMLDEQLAQSMSSKGVGVANALISQLSRNAGLAGSNASAGGGAAGMLGAMTGGGNAGGADAGNTAMLNALARAYSNSAANGALAGGSGYSAASALTPPLRGNGESPKVDAFVEKMAAPAQAASAATGIPARFIIGQAALESGWGKGEIKNANGTPSHNVFGIKATKDWTGKTVTAVTTEYVNGKPQKVVEKFRAYDSYADAMTDYAKMLRNNPRYASVVNNSHDAASFARGMQRAGYATDPHYARKLISIMQQMV
ncbi:flagellar protein FlgJ [Trinickia symbiotica]|uniref:Peptidoglycan hydrolase FlgJ n=1 Tax=Trinickia symbiotica TaxID=863227 RepID=A0A2N7WN96_9BURK|nr:flagellar assembly peptidoglycan hydrolase FlgJ [Trinickia symbiotica]PMS30805.1 flagellar assembly peptidoglycan hydrolase FlgJ [Trinickia symbiotica]PPK41508.1 flagellar protein FlgJ [Trinickia symbiotica]